MKKFFGLIILAFAAVLTFSACGDDDEIIIDPTDDLVALTGNLTTRTLTADKQYLIQGQVFVGDGQVLTIEPGTVIFGDKKTRGTLVIDKGGRIEANGTVDKPIVFTSNQEEGIRDRGDWGGLVILGRANTNQVEPAIEGITPVKTFGTTNDNSFDNESSGTLRYVRVEFAGIELTPNNETNSITMGGVGRGTTMEYCMVSFGGDDGFEWFGGTVNGKYFVSFCMWDDDFDVDYGYSGNVQFGLVIRYPGFADQSQSNGFECDNGPNDNDVMPYTTGTFSNITVIGPIKTGTSTSNANYAHSIDLRRRTAVSIFNSVFVGFPRGLRMNQPSVLANYQSGLGVLENNVMVTPAVANKYLVGSGVSADDVKAYWEAANTTIDGPADDAIHTTLGINPELFFGSRLADAYPSAPDFRVSSGTISTGAKFTNAKFNEANRAGFFNNVNFIGAFGSENWTAGWAEFAPVSKVY
jgi:hypothetical protein